MAPGEIVTNRGFLKMEIAIQPSINDSFILKRGWRLNANFYQIFGASLGLKSPAIK